MQPEAGAGDLAVRGTEGLGTLPALRPVTDRWVQEGLRAAMIRRPAVRMVPGSVRSGGRRVAFAVSDNEGAHGPGGPGTEPVWAVSLHGYFAGAWMYARESARLAERLGWRVVNPSLPGFGGSDPLAPSAVSVDAMADVVEAVLAHVGAGPAVLLGHSMGGAVAVHRAATSPRSVLGVIYRAGVATPAWQRRRGVVARMVAPLLPDLADTADMASAILLDTPDILAGRLYSTLRSLLPDFRHNLRQAGRTLPVGTMLMSLDLSDEVRQLARDGLPFLSEWGCWDRVVTPETADELEALTGHHVHWVPGGHSWMLARPQGQADILCYLGWGRRFRSAVEARWALLTQEGPSGRRGVEGRGEEGTLHQAEPAPERGAGTLGTAQGDQLTA